MGAPIARRLEAAGHELLVAPGGPFVFVDEIEIYKGEPDWVAAA